MLHHSVQLTILTASVSFPMRYHLGLEIDVLSDEESSKSGSHTC